MKIITRFSLLISGFLRFSEMIKEDIFVLGKANLSLGQLGTLPLLPIEVMRFRGKMI